MFVLLNLNDLIESALAKYVKKQSERSLETEVLWNDKISSFPPAYLKLLNPFLTALPTLSPK